MRTQARDPERRYDLLAYLRKRKTSVSVEQMARHLKVTHSTIHNYLRMLENEQLIKKTSVRVSTLRVTLAGYQFKRPKRLQKPARAPRKKSSVWGSYTPHGIPTDRMIEIISQREDARLAKLAELRQRSTYAANRDQ